VDEAKTIRARSSATVLATPRIEMSRPFVSTAVETYLNYLWKLGEPEQVSIVQCYLQYSGFHPHVRNIF
jgi:hypothetical protein